MKKWVALIGVICVLLTSCTSGISNGTSNTASSNVSSEANNSINIVRHPKIADFSFFHEGKTGDDIFISWGNSIDYRSGDFSNVDFTEKEDKLMYASFDSKTKWPEKLPEGFDPTFMMEQGKNPGLGVRGLHEQGITGENIGIAIIDQVLLADHIEYKDTLKYYNEIGALKGITYEASMHGPAVASIAVGKTVGVAPRADLYYIAADSSIWVEEKDSFIYDYTDYTAAVREIIAVNKDLPTERKIRVISISLGFIPKEVGYDAFISAVKEAKADNIEVITTESLGDFDAFLGFGRDLTEDLDSTANALPGLFWKDSLLVGTLAGKDLVLIPMDTRTTASPTGKEDYVYYADGGMSWAVPYLAGLYALACQVDPTMDADTFTSILASTAVPKEYEENGKTYQLGMVADPPALIEEIKKQAK